MSKDPTRNIDRYKIRGGQMNAFEFHQNQGAVSEQRQEHGNWAGASEEETDLPPDKAKAERIRQLLSKHGESVPQADGNSTDEYQTDEELNGKNRNAQQEEVTSDRARERKDQNQKKDAESAEEDFAPTHGRSPKVIKKMIQSRRATDKVPDPEDIIAGRADQSEEKKERGETGRRTSTRQTNKQTVRRQPQTAAKGKEAALDRSKPGTVRGTSAKKEGKQPAARKNAKVVAASAPKRQSDKQVATTRSAKKTQSGASARNSAAGSRSASSRQKTTTETTTRSAKNRRTTAPKRAKSSAGKSR